MQRGVREQVRVEERSPPLCLSRDRIIFCHEREREREREDLLLLLSSYTSKRVRRGETKGDLATTSLHSREVGGDGKRESGRYREREGEDFSISCVEEMARKRGDERDRERERASRWTGED